MIGDPPQIHVRLLEQLRDQTRTHERRVVVQPRGLKYTLGARLTLRERLRDCFRRGLNRKQACKECGTTNKTIVKIFGNSKKLGRPRR